MRPSCYPGTQAKPIYVEFLVNDPMQTKNELRTCLNAARNRLPSKEVKRRSLALATIFYGTVAFLFAKRIALYCSYGCEVQTDSIWRHSRGCGKSVYYPKIDITTDHMNFVRREEAELLESGRFGIPTPRGAELLCNVGDADIVLVPGLGFDREGNRLGRGRGYYDRVLSGSLRNALKFGIAFDVQLVDRIPCSPTDQKVDFLITESRFISCSADKIPFQA